MANDVPTYDELVKRFNKIRKKANNEPIYNNLTFFQKIKLIKYFDCFKCNRKTYIQRSNSAPSPRRVRSAPSPLTPSRVRSVPSPLTPSPRCVHNVPSPLTPSPRRVLPSVHRRPPPPVPKNKRKRSDSLESILAREAAIEIQKRTMNKYISSDLYNTTKRLHKN